MNGLSVLLNQFVGGDNYCGVKISDNLTLNHLLFADDTLLFCENREDQLETLCNVLISFLFASGLKINYQKSELIGCNVPYGEVERLAALFGWKVGSLPIQYLGAPLGDNPRRISFWRPMIDKLRCKARSWNSKYISLSGRLVLAKSVLCSIPLFLMAIFKAPKGVVVEVEKILRAFLWGRDQGRGKVNWIGWEQICMNKEAGGLGLGFIEWKNRAMLLKWAWRFGREVGSLWRMVIVEKYHLDHNSLLWHKELTTPRCWSRIVQDIVRILLDEHLLSAGFRDNLLISVGDGRRVNFWKDPWADHEALCTLFPRLFAMCDNKDVRIAEVGSFRGGKWSWSLSFRRDFFAWEEELYKQFCLLINSIIPAHREVDLLVWCLNQNGNFAVKELCYWLEGQLFNTHGWQVPKAIAKLLPPKVSLFLWQALRNKIATRENLQAKGIVLNGSSSCPICNEVSESSSHLLLHCPSIWRLWCSILNRDGISWAVPSTLSALMLEWENLPKISDKILWNLIPYSLVWSIWIERNNVCFNQKDFNSSDIWDMHLLRIGWWVKPILIQSSYSVDQVIRNFELIRFAPSVPKIRCSSWSPPEAGLIKINVDGAAIGCPGMSGIGGIFRNNKNEILVFFSKNIGVGFAFEAEIWAIHEALKICAVNFLRNIIIESDASLAVGWVNNRYNRPWKLHNALNQIDQWVSEVNCLKVKHIFREANSEADKLAKRGAAHSKDLFYFNAHLDA